MVCSNAELIKIDLNIVAVLARTRANEDDEKKSAPMRATEGDWKIEFQFSSSHLTFISRCNQRAPPSSAELESINVCVTHAPGVQIV